MSAEAPLALAPPSSLEMRKHAAIIIATIALLLACTRRDVKPRDTLSRTEARDVNGRESRRDTRPGATRPIQDDFRIEPGRAGPVENGMTVDRLYEVVGRESVTLRDLYDEGEFTPAVAIEIAGGSAHPSMVARVTQRTAPPCPGFVLSRLEVDDPRFRTAEGLGVGSTLSALKRTYRLTGGLQEGEDGTLDAITSAYTFALESGHTPLDSSRVKFVLIWSALDSVKRHWC